MDRLRSDLVIHVITWILLSIGLPLLPIGIGIMIALLQKVEVSLVDLLNGVELSLISLGLVTATGIDLSRAAIQRSARPLVFFIIRLALVLLGAASIILLTLIYVDIQMTEVEFDKNRKMCFVVILALSAVLFTVALQLYIGYFHYRRGIEESDS